MVCKDEPMRRCIVNAQGCLKKFIPKRYWQKICDNYECKRVRNLERAKKHQKKNIKSYMTYQKKYRSLNKI